MAKKASLAKVSRPRLFGVIGRERLFALLDGNRGRPLVWIHGPPGAGKTTLVATYVESRELATLWYQIDAGDGDPASLFQYLASGVGALRGTDTAALPRFAPEHLSDIRAFSRLFFRSLFSELPDGAILVFDNYQEAAPNGHLQEILQSSVAEVPRNGSIVCVSRTEPPATLVELAAKGEMYTLSSSDLQLTLEEVRAIASHRRAIDTRLLKDLHRQSEGWAAGVTLILERLSHRDDRSQIPHESRESVFNYFASLVFDRASDDVRRILLSVAFVPHTTPTLATTLSGNCLAPAVLEDLYHRSMFTDRRRGPEPVYQFHALFLAFLKSRAVETFSAPELDELLERSALALESNGDVEAAIEIWLEARRWEHAARVMATEASRLLSAGRRQTLVRWIEQMPEVVRTNDPWLLLWLGRAQLEVAPDAGVKTLEASLAVFRLGKDHRGRIECLTALLSGAFLGFHALEAMDRWLDELLSQVELAGEFASPELETRVWGVLAVTLFHVRPWHPLTVPAYQRIEELLPNCTDPATALVAATHALVVSGLSGDFEYGDRLASASRARAVQANASPSDAAWWFAQVAWLRLFEARYEEALESIQRACQIAESNGLRLTLRQTILWRFTIESRSVSWSAANASLAEVEAMPKPTQPMVEATLTLFRARRAIYRGQKEEAVRLALLSQEAAMRTRSRLEEVIFCLCNADILVDAGRADEARPLLEQVRTLVERTPAYQCFHAVVVFIDARCSLGNGERVLGLMQLRQSLALARESNGRFYLRLCDYAMPPLFLLALGENIEMALVRDLIEMFRLKAPTSASDLWPWPVLIRTLGRFEVCANGRPLQFARKIPKKTLALLKALIAYGGRDVPEQSLCDALWADEEADAARESLGITVLRLRKLLGSNETVSQQGGKISLDRTLCWADIWQFEDRAALPQSPPDVAKTLELYGGAFLPEDDGEPWSVPTRERLRGKFIHLLATHGNSLEAQGQIEGALELYLRGVDADPIIEAFHQGAMRCYGRLGRHTEAISAFRRLKQTLSAVLGITPSTQSCLLYEQIIATCRGTSDTDGLQSRRA